MGIVAVWHDESQINKYFIEEEASGPYNGTKLCISRALLTYDEESTKNRPSIKRQLKIPSKMTQTEGYIVICIGAKYERMLHNFMSILFVRMGIRETFMSLLTLVTSPYSISV